MPRKKPSNPVPPLEWISACLGLLLLVALVGILLNQAIRSNGDDLPLLSARTGRIAATQDSHIVEVVVHNASPRTAASVGIEGTLASEGSASETSSASIDYVPGHSSAEASLLFTKDPRKSRLTVRVTGYELP